MDYDELKEAVFTTIDADDRFKASKQLQIKHWCSAFIKYFINRQEMELSFFLDILSDKDCWEEVDSVHGMKLNRRKLAKKMIEPVSWRGTISVLDDFERYQIACRCCLEDDVHNLFEHFKEECNIKSNDTIAMRNFVASLSGDLESFTDAMMEYWSCVVSNSVPELNLEGRQLYVYGLYCVLGKTFYKHVEAVEFFWNKIKDVPETVLSAQKKEEIFMNNVVHASASTCGSQPEIFEFCFSQISPDKYPEVLKRDLDANRHYASFNRLKNSFRFDLFQKLFDCLMPYDISFVQYYHWLRLLNLEKYPEYYASGIVELFLYMWRKEGFDSHRSFVIEEELSTHYQGNLLVSFVNKNRMEPVWAILDKAVPGHLGSFKNSKERENICNMLLKRDQKSFIKFLNYTNIFHLGHHPNVSELNEENDLSYN